MTYRLTLRKEETGKTRGFLRNPFKSSVVETCETDCAHDFLELVKEMTDAPDDGEGTDDYCIRFLGENYGYHGVNRETIDRLKSHYKYIGKLYENISSVVENNRIGRFVFKMPDEPNEIGSEDKSSDYRSESFAIVEIDM